MPDGSMNPKVDFFFDEATKWQKEYEQLRTIILDCGLTEELKWGCPCYTFEERNIVLIHGFKEYCAILFFKGALLNDPDNILIRQTKNVQAARQVRFTSVDEIIKLKPVISAYVYEAIEVEKSGVKPNIRKNPEPIPEELHKKFDEMPALKTAFDALTPGRQRGYILYFSQPKQSRTRESRIEKCMEKILNGQGLYDSVNKGFKNI